MKRGIKKLLGIAALTTVLTFSTVGCGSQQLRVPGEETAVDRDAWTETEGIENEETKEKEDSQASGKEEQTETTVEETESDTEKKETQETEEEEYLDVESAEDTEVDYSKYEEKKTEQKNAAEEGETVEETGDDAGVQDEYYTEPVPEGKPEPVEPDDTQVNDSQTGTCYLSISCDTILNNMADLTEGKEILVPEDGVIFAQQEVTFYQGESVYDVLLRETQNNRIHMEASFTPKYNSAYVEGINNLYEFDCGKYSGWMYSVNDWYPNYGCSRYQVQDGDVIEWNYTCDLGRDLGQTWEE